ncbi:uncharacterized protein LOC109449076 [Rhinolophus sinicus]|uniref:uncharacterized protein LOC109449076 n=1 Tax=Rhinolophus sinicus TaxID=89399 RepID=UPI003D78FEBC
MFAAAATASSSLATWQRQQPRRLLPQRRPHSGGGAPSPPRLVPLPLHTDTVGSGGGRGGMSKTAAAFSGAPGEGRQERSPRAFVGAVAGAAATAAAAAGNHTGSSVPGCSSCCHDDDVTDATTGGGEEGAGQAPGQDTPAEVFSPPPPGKQQGSRAGRKPGPRSARRIDDSASGHGHLGEGQRRGRRSADVIDGLGGACGNGGASAVLAVRRDWPELRFSRSPRRPPFHIPQRRRGQPRRRLFTSVRHMVGTAEISFPCPLYCTIW